MLQQIKTERNKTPQKLKMDARNTISSSVKMPGNFACSTTSLDVSVKQHDDEANSPVMVGYKSDELKHTITEHEVFVLLERELRQHGYHKGKVIKQITNVRLQTFTLLIQIYFVINMKCVFKYIIAIKDVSSKPFLNVFFKTIINYSFR